MMSSSRLFLSLLLLLRLLHQSHQFGGTPKTPLVITLTRETGKNEKLSKKLTEVLSSSDSYGNDCVLREIPCIEHATGPDSEKLIPTLLNNRYSSVAHDYTVITSPEAASVLAEAWNLANQPDLGQVAAVGKATKDTLDSYGISVAFVPSKATSKTLVEELPTVHDHIKTRVLYPASLKAKETLKTGLEGRGSFEVTRLNTYDTVTAKWSEDQSQEAMETSIVCFGSPSAVEAWISNTNNKIIPAACIGETSAQACRDLGWEESDIFYPEKPGVEGWADAVVAALEAKFWG